MTQNDSFELIANNNKENLELSTPQKFDNLLCLIKKLRAEWYTVFADLKIFLQGLLIVLRLLEHQPVLIKAYKKRKINNTSPNTIN